jgi:hypothetical protein
MLGTGNKKSSTSGSNGSGEKEGKLLIPKVE